MVVAAIVGALIGIALIGDQPEAEASARLKLAERVGWPTHDSVRLEILSWVQEPEFVSSLGLGKHGFKAELPRNQAYIDLHSQADSDADATRALKLAIEHITTREDTVSIEPFRVTVASAQATLKSVEGELEEVNAQLAEAETSTLINQQGSLIWRAEQLEAEIDEAQRDLAKQVPRILQLGENELSDGQRLHRARAVSATSLLAAITMAAIQTLRSSREPDFASAKVEPSVDETEEE